MSPDAPSPAARTAPQAAQQNGQQNGKTAAFDLKGLVFPLAALRPHTRDLEAVAAKLDQTLKRSAALVTATPLVLDLAATPDLDADGLRGLAELLRARELPLVGFTGANPTLAEAAQSLGLTFFRKSVGETEVPERPRGRPAPSASPQAPGNGDWGPALIIDQPVRSGQKIYAQGRDLTLMGPVSHGAEVLADGNIHAYGPLRGRALAGARGLESARIFCHSLEAELVSIAGFYATQEDLPAEMRGVSVAIRLDGQRLAFDKL